jgi:DNA polymerase I-like protein with 3'-5' exonuclease and polymerase domains
MARVALVDKCPSRNKYEEYFEFPIEVFHLSSVYLTKVLKKDVDLDLDVSLYDFVIVVGSEACKYYTKASVTNTAGTLIDGKFLPMINPAVLIFKPEGKQDFKRNVAQITDFVTGVSKDATLTGDFKGIQDTEEAIEFLHEVLSQPILTVALDTETTCLAPRDGYVLGVSISYKLNHGRYISSDCLTDECIELLQRIVDKHFIVFHHMKFDWKMMEYHFGLKFNRDIGFSHDTMVEHYVLDETEGTHGLKALAIKHTNYGDYDKELTTFKDEYCRIHAMDKADFTYDLIPWDTICIYAAIDTAVTLELHHKFYPIIQAHPKLNKLYHELMIPSTIFLTDMEEVGIPLSRERLETAAVFLNAEIESAKQELYTHDIIHSFERIQGAIFNPNSVNQLRALLFDHVGLNTTGKLTATGAISTDAEVLTELAEVHPIPAIILKVRRLTKLRNTYIEKILPAIDRDGRIRTNFNNTFTSSGRLSSSGKFNAQQIPRDDPIIKGCIQAPPGWLITQQDLTTAEVYYAAVLSGDKKLQEVFKSGGDLHSTIAKMVFNLECEVDDVKKLYPLKRQAAKAITFGILYGSGARKVSETVTKDSGTYFSLSEAQETIDFYFQTFSKLKKWLKDQKLFIEANGYCYSFFGRKRRLQNVFSPDKGIASHEVRSGINAQVQSLASDINVYGAMEAMEEFKSRGMQARIFMLVHDSIVVLHPEEETNAVCEILKRCTQKDRGCSIPGCPVGVDQDTHRDYSVGKFEKKYEIIGNSLSRIQGS